MWVQRLRKEIVLEYEKLIKNLEVGKLYNYTHILDMINLTETINYIDNVDIKIEYLLHK